jgi:hypothetical protein
MRLLDFRSFIHLPALALAILCLESHAQKDLTFNGGASMGFGQIVKSSDTTSFHYSGNRIQTVAAQIKMKGKFNDKLLVSTGLGIVERHYPAGSIGNNGGRTPFVMSPVLINADFNYSWWDTGDKKLNLSGGYFPFTYNPDVKNLGLYLLRGPVYPGILISGFETKHTKPVSNTLGFKVQHVTGAFEQNLIFNSETETYPHFDVSPAYLASMQLGAAFHLGAGINFSHLITVDSRLTSPDTFAYDASDLPSSLSVDPNSRTWAYVDTIAHDTSFLSFAGTKVMANASFDPKPFFGSDALSPEDLKLYAEIAVIGLDMSGPYKAIYGGYLQRMPVMMGFNAPTFKFLDHLSLEVEWYGAKFKDDLARYQSTTGSYHSPLPVVNSHNMNLKRDDWKWSLHAQRTIGQIRLSAQVANDHSRPGGTLTSPSSEWEAFYVTPKDWYWMTKAAFFF